MISLISGALKCLENKVQFRTFLNDSVEIVHENGCYYLFLKKNDYNSLKNCQKYS